MKPAIDDLRTTLHGLGELRNTLADLSRQTASIGDLKVLTSELKVAMREIRSSVPTAGAPGMPTPGAPAFSLSAAPAAGPAVPATRPLAAQIASRAVDQAKAQTTVYKASRSAPTTPPGPTVGPSPPSPSIPLPPAIPPPTASPVAPSMPAVPMAPPAPVPGATGQKGKTPPIVTEVMTLLTQRAQSGTSADALANILENARDTISKSWRWHPALYELGTIARKLRKIPKGQSADAELLKELMLKIKEWLEKMVD